MGQCLRELDVLPEDQGFILSTLMGQTPVILVPRDPTPSSGLYRHQAWCRHISKQYIHRCENKIILINKLGMVTLVIPTPSKIR